MLSSLYFRFTRGRATPLKSFLKVPYVARFETKFRRPGKQAFYSVLTSWKAVNLLSIHTSLQRRCLILFIFSPKQTLTALPGFLTHSYSMVACRLSPIGSARWTNPTEASPPLERCLVCSNAPMCVHSLYASTCTLYSVQYRAKLF
jgi:hypothetical protein